MGATGAVKCARVVANVTWCIAIEALVAAQGIDVRHPLSPGRGVAAAHAALRAEVPTLTGDRTLGPDIHRVAELVRSGALRRAAEDAVGSLA